ALRQEKATVLASLDAALRQFAQRSTEDGPKEEQQQRAVSEATPQIEQPSDAAPQQPTGDREKGNARSEVRTRLIQIYAKHKPEKAGDVDALLDKYAGREDDLLAKVAARYETVYPPATGDGPRAFMDVAIGGKPAGRLVFKLFQQQVPITAENFRALCTGEKTVDGRRAAYAGSVFHRIIPGFAAQGGDYERGDGTGGRSVYAGTPAADAAGKFADEAFMRHDRRGLLSMANCGPNSNGSQFFITLAPALHLNGKHCVFGEVVEGTEVLEAIEACPTKPAAGAVGVGTGGRVVVVACGELGEGESGGGGCGSTGSIGAAAPVSAAEPAGAAPVPTILGPDAAAGPRPAKPPISTVGPPAAGATAAAGPFGAGNFTFGCPLAGAAGGFGAALPPASAAAAAPAAKSLGALDFGIITTGPAGREAQPASDAAVAPPRPANPSPRAPAAAAALPAVVVPTAAGGSRAAWSPAAVAAMSPAPAAASPSAAKAESPVAAVAVSPAAAAEAPAVTPVSPAFAATASDGGSDAESSDGEEVSESERAEELAKAAAAFDAIDVPQRGFATPEQWPLLFGSLGTTWCEEEHRKLLSRMTDAAGGGVRREAFLVGYTEWLFGGDDDTGDDDEDGGNGCEGGAAAVGFGGLGLVGAGTWRCESCL
ncbi:unnamed protein product, partial [Phaeothamnion confervicola]